MGSHPINQAFRILLELIAIISKGMWAWNLSEDWYRYILVIIFPLIIASIWGIFAVPEDPSHSGNSPIPTPGIIRLLIEILLFGFGAWSLYSLSYQNLSYIYSFLLILHNIISYDRILWLLKR